MANCNDCGNLLDDDGYCGECYVYEYPDFTDEEYKKIKKNDVCLLYTSPSPRDGLLSRMPSSA